MFDSEAFHSWPHIILGASIFAVLFGLMTAMGEALFDGYFRPSRVSLGLAVGAFIGYLGVALLVRHQDAQD